MTEIADQGHRMANQSVSCYWIFCTRFRDSRVLLTDRTNPASVAVFFSRACEHVKAIDCRRIRHRSLVCYRSFRRDAEEISQTGSFQGCGGLRLAQDGHAWPPAGNEHMVELVSPKDSLDVFLFYFIYLFLRQVRQNLSIVFQFKSWPSFTQFTSAFFLFHRAWLIFRYPDFPLPSSLSSEIAVKSIVGAIFFDAASNAKEPGRVFHSKQSCIWCTLTRFN